MRAEAVLRTLVCLLVAASGASCGFDPHPKSGAMACAVVGQRCLEGYVCGMDNLCWLKNTPDAGGKLDGGAESQSTGDATVRTGDAGGTGDVTATGGNVDAGTADAKNADAGITDSGNRDAEIIAAVKTDVPIVDASNLDTTTFDTTTFDTPTFDTRNLDTPNFDIPNFDTRNFDTPNFDTPNLDAVKTDVPIVDGSNLDTRNFDTPNFDIPNFDSPSIDAEDHDAVSADVGKTDVLVGPAIVINLGLATPFAVAATAGITNTITAPITHINGNAVLTPNQTCNAVPVDNAGGFGLCGGMTPTINGTVVTDTYPDTTTAAAIKADLNAAFLRITPLAGPPAVGSLGGSIPIAAPRTLGNVTGSALVLGDNYFTPGVYASITSILITGDLTLDGQGDPNAIFIFQSASTLTTADGAQSPGAHTRILLTNGTKASNVWWQVASSATMGSYCEFQGNILAAFDITMKTGSTTCGRSMAGAWVGGAGAFIFDSNVVSVPGNGCPL